MPSLAGESALADQMKLYLKGCFGDEARGALRNNSDVRVDVWVDVEFLDGSGDLVSTSGDLIPAENEQEKRRQAYDAIQQSIQAWRQ